jgi:catechol 2,3-dioxygenase-like lactoylglutathione lyase family enzyme
MSTPPISFSHIGLCVRNLERSLLFYCDGLGFERAESFPLDDSFAGSLEVGGVIALTSQFIRRGDVTIELLGWELPEPAGTPSTSRQQLGFTHLSFYVDDLEATAQRLVRLGGELLPDTRHAIPGAIEFVFLADPDGARVELMQAAAQS